MLVAWVVAAFLIAVTVPIASKVAAAEGDPRLARLLMWAAVVHIAFAPISIYVVDHYYRGLTDYNHYIGQGAVLAKNFDALHFTLAGSTLKSPVGLGAVSIGAGLVFAVIGVNKLAAFFVFGWLAYIGAICFFRAFTTTFPRADHRRYALIIFFLPSLLFWTAGVSKESLMFCSLGVTAYGAARLLAQRPGGLMLLMGGAAIGLYIRPQELLLFLAAVSCATLFRARSGRALRGLRRIGVMILQGMLLGVALALTRQVRGPVFSLTQIAANGQGQSSSVTYHTSPVFYFQDVFYTLLDPLLFNAHGSGQYVASIENLTILVLIVISWRRLRTVPRAMFMRPYIMSCVLYCLIWMYMFSALANLGLIERERVLMLPFFFVLLAIPVADKGRPPQFEWEVSRKERRRKSRKQWSRRAKAPKLVPSSRDDVLADLLEPTDWPSSALPRDTS